jgi:hypothetical protein
MANLKDILDRLDRTLSGLNAKGTGVISGLNQTLNNLGNKIGAGTPLPGGQQGPPSPPGAASKFFADFLSQGDLKSKLDQLAGVTGGLGLEKLSKGLLTATTAARAIEGDPTAMLELGKEAISVVRNRIQEFQIHSQRAMQEGVASFTSERAPTAYGHGLRAGGEMAEGIVPGPLGKLANASAKFSATLVESVDRLRDFNNQLFQSDMQFAEFSAAMAGVQIENEVRNAFLSAERGERRAESARFLAEGRFGLEQQMARFEDPFARIKDRLIGTLDRAIARGIDLSGLGTVADVVSKILDWLDEHEDVVSKVGDVAAAAAFGPFAFAPDIAKAAMKGMDAFVNYGKPKRMQP